MNPKVVCLCPTFGRPRLLENSIACFLAQTYTNKELFILDDAGQYLNTVMEYQDKVWYPCREVRHGIRLCSLAARFDTLTAKYNAMAAMSRGSFMHADILCIWEDDDIYLPWHIESIVQSLVGSDWVKSSRVFSTYTGELLTEPAAGRFHASLGFTPDALHRSGGWPATGRGDFDQQLIRQFQTACGDPADPCWRYAPGYAFRWASTGAYHGQAYMKGGDDTSWYDRSVRDVSIVPEPLLKPQQDQETQQVMASAMQVWSTEQQQLANK